MVWYHLLVSRELFKPTCNNNPDAGALTIVVAAPIATPSNAVLDVHAIPMSTLPPLVHPVSAPPLLHHLVHVLLLRPRRAAVHPLAKSPVWLLSSRARPVAAPSCCQYFGALVDQGYSSNAVRVYSGSPSSSLSSPNVLRLVSKQSNE